MFGFIVLAYPFLKIETVDNASPVMIKITGKKISIPNVFLSLI